MPRIAQLPIYNDTETQRPQDEKKRKTSFFSRFPTGEPIPLTQMNSRFVREYFVRREKFIETGFIEPEEDSDSFPNPKRETHGSIMEMFGLFLTLREQRDHDPAPPLMELAQAPCDTDLTRLYSVLKTAKRYTIDAKFIRASVKKGKLFSYARWGKGGNLCHYLNPRDIRAWIITLDPRYNADASSAV